MKIGKMYIGFALIGFCMVASLYCAKESEQKVSEQSGLTNTRVRYDESVPMASADENQAKHEKDDERNFFTSARLKSMLVLPMEKAKERLLEYHVSLSYQCHDFHKARTELISIISQYGFIKTGNTDVSHTSYLYINAAIQAKDIYRFLLDMDRVGVLVTENIRVNDLTEEMVISQRRLRREEIRIERKQKALAGMPANARNWQGIEGSISQSEDSYDQAEHAKWKVLDRVAWANVNISLKPFGSVHVPPYRKALYDLVDLALWIPYALIYLLPLILLGMLIRWKWRRLKSFFVKKESSSE